MRNNEERFDEVRQQSAANDPIAPFSAQKQEQGISLNFISPTIFVPLPSKGRFYPEGHPLKDQETIEIKEMTAREEDILTNRSLIKKGLVFDKLISSILVDKRIKVDDLLIGDKNAILLASRASAYGDDYSFEVTCPSCQTKNKKHVSMQTILEKEFEDPTETEAGTARLPSGNVLIKLPKTGWIVECRLLTSDDEQKILRLAEARKKINNAAEASLIDNMSLIVVSIEGVIQKNLIEAALMTIPAKDSKHLRTVYQKYVPSVDMKTLFNCSSCEFEQEMEIPLTADFFWSN